MSGPLVVITCGPAGEPIDAVRRITNFSTGALGTAMAELLAREGWRVLCLRGEGATSPAPQGVEVRSWMSNVDLWRLLDGLEEEPAVILQAAALADFTVGSIRQAGQLLIELPAKLESRAGEVELSLRPAMKILEKLRERFPGSRIVGWKYEAEVGAGSQERAEERVRRQLVEARVDATVLNGPVLGAGWQWWQAGKEPVGFSGREEFLSQLPGLLRFDTVDR